MVKINNLWRLAISFQLFKLLFKVMGYLLHLFTVLYRYLEHLDSTNRAFVLEFAVLEKTLSAECMSTFIYFQGLKHKNHANRARSINILILLLKIGLTLYYWFLLKDFFKRQLSFCFRSGDFCLFLLIFWFFVVLKFF